MKVLPVAARLRICWAMPASRRAATADRVPAILVMLAVVMVAMAAS
jgi:hypothetical protein